MQSAINQLSRAADAQEIRHERATEEPRIERLKKRLELAESNQRLNQILSALACAS